MSNRNRNYILLFILVMIGVFIMSGFFGNMTKNIIDHIRYRGTLVTGEITVDNENGTYDVKINNANSAYKSVETVTYGAIFSVGEIVVIGYEYGSKELPKILGHSKKIPQEPYESEVDYSGGGEDGEGSGEGEGGGKVTKTVTVYSGAKDGKIFNSNANYDTCHDAVSGSSKNDSDDYFMLGYGHSSVIDHYIQRAYLFFDTSAIPSGANITIAKLYMKYDDVHSTMDEGFYVVIQDGQPTYPHSTLILSDYDCSKYVNNGGSISDADLDYGGGYSIITLNPNGRNWINAGGLTKFCLRASIDISKTYWAILDHFADLAFYSSEKGGDYRPKLVITYEI